MHLLGLCNRGVQPETQSDGACDSLDFAEGNRRARLTVKRGNDVLRQAFNWALFRLWEKGRYTDLWLRYFPINPF